MIKLKDVLKEVLKNIDLDKKEISKIKKRSQEIVQVLKKNSNENIILGGSFAKNTLIKKEIQDIDIFIIFENEESTKNLEKILKKSKIDAKKIHGSRDYFQLKENNTIFEFIPIVKIGKNNKNVTDFSPLHVKYINKKTNKNKELLKEIKLAKHFCIAQEVYGAESYIQGFSGYALELLICYYKNFTNFLKGIQKDDFIDIEKQFKNKKEAFREINQSKLLSPIVLIDPTQKYRNVCAGLNKESLEKLKDSAKKFLRNPSEDFFNLKVFNEADFLKNYKKKGVEIYVLELRTDRENKDIAGTKMKKFFNFLLRELGSKEQKILSSEFVYDGGKIAKSYIAIIPKEFLEIVGPKKEMKEAVERFKKARKNIFFSKGFACTKEKFVISKFFKDKKVVSKSMDITFDWEKL
jgi:tRNA nucleotidyltransferase (CCA-adding enzyme)